MVVSDMVLYWSQNQLYFSKSIQRVILLTKWQAKTTGNIPV